LEDLPNIVMYSRGSCGLCDEARAVIQSERARGPRPAFQFDEVFIDGDERLEREYGLRVPVVEIDGLEQFEFHVDPARLRALLEG
jgi:hypothetical protein